MQKLYFYIKGFSNISYNTVIDKYDRSHFSFGEELTF